ncbi:hypothetical protein C5B42_00985 [Candidatus Cerribacteria bacterium 'Amazon FNV 2010 28 9']|uniref:Uncharacterized protein n=1 Tax=Candidatus Cerribacteria bacterium 'Amazon FNV 2010 28 9' TaxID=2081795 RepID=A0A317JV15_9BACT|nr:MAG: hypothetical protein C5B42_00985 [Candidatus Cerribacteria bacterium 'Amazon FNV 2010 28 9']
MTESFADQPLHVFVREEDYYSNPEVILIVAATYEAAMRMYEQLDEDGHEQAIRHISTLQELNIFVPAIFVLRPPGERNFLR